MADRDEDDAGLLERLAATRKLLQRAVAEGEVEAGIAAAGLRRAGRRVRGGVRGGAGPAARPGAGRGGAGDAAAAGRGDALVHGSVRVASGGWGRGRERPLPRSPDPCRAVRGQRRSSSPHPEAAAPGDELGRVRGRLASARQPDGVVHGRGNRGLARRAPDHARRAALVLAAGGPDRADAAGRVPPRPAPDRGSGRLDPPSARPRARVYDHATLSRRAGTLEVPRPRPTGEAVHLLVDSTGLRLSGPGEWLIEKHGTKARRAWKKLPLGVGAGTGRDRGRGADRPRDGRRLPGRAVGGPGG